MSCPPDSWLAATSFKALIDYFRCEVCGAVWVLDETLDLHAGLLFADMAQAHSNHERRDELTRRAVAAYRMVKKLMGTCADVRDRQGAPFGGPPHATDRDREDSVRVVAIASI